MRDMQINYVKQGGHHVIQGNKVVEFFTLLSLSSSTGTTKKVLSDLA